jgi:hypothetical protein
MKGATMFKNIKLAYKLLKMFKSHELIVTKCAFCGHIQFTTPVVIADTHRAFLSEEELKKFENLEYYNCRTKCKNCGAEVEVHEEWTKGK